MTTDAAYMQLAIAEAVEAKAQGELPIGAIVVSGTRIIARNRCREGAERTVLAHAELHAVNDACKMQGTNDLSGCSVYCTNEPCMMCAAAIFQARIARVVIGASRSDFPHVFRRRRLCIDDLAADSGYAPQIIRGVLRDDVISLFDGIARF